MSDAQDLSKSIGRALQWKVFKGVPLSSGSLKEGRYQKTQVLDLKTRVGTETWVFKKVGLYSIRRITLMSQKKSFQKSIEDKEIQFCI